jgi:hypothetical protein
MTLRYSLGLRRLSRDSHDVCSVCGRPFIVGETSHLGYDFQQREVYVGDCCSHILVETAVRNRWERLPYTIPNPQTRLWRYMDFAKLVCLAKDRALYFARADQLGDRFEGAKGLQHMKQTYDEHYLRFFRDSVRHPPAGYICQLSEEEIDKAAQHLLKNFEVANRAAIRSTFVSCWHESEHESEAQWRLYCPLGSAGVALCTTYSALKNSLGDDLSITIGRVTYLDFSKTFAGPNDWIFRKRHSLSHEKEVRAITWQPHESSADTLGLQHHVDIGQLIQKIVISPFAPSWFEGTLRDTLKRYGVIAQIVESELATIPFY